jgi:hypothetical protein
MGRDGDDGVVVPLRLYKTVTVVSTLIAVVAVVGGFVLLDVATQRASVPASRIDPVLGTLGLASILGGALVYAYATRFRAEGMGKDKTEGDEPDDDG